VNGTSFVSISQLKDKWKQGNNQSIGNKWFWFEFRLDYWGGFWQEV